MNIITTHKKIKDINLQQGFTLVETLVALLIFSISLAGLGTIAARGVSGTRGAANEIIAQYLVQEGIERVRYIRDSNYASVLFNSEVVSWDEGLDACANDDGCIISFNPGSVDMTISECPSAGCPPLTLTRGVYDYGGAEPSLFTRSIYIDFDKPNQAVIRSEVTWKQGTLDRVSSASEVVVHWQSI